MLNETEGDVVTHTFGSGDGPLCINGAEYRMATRNVKGSVTGITLDGLGSGTYQVNADCTGSTSFQPDPNNPDLVIVEKFVIIDDGNEIRSMAASLAALMVIGVGKRVGKH